MDGMKRTLICITITIALSFWSVPTLAFGSGKTKGDEFADGVADLSAATSRLLSADKSSDALVAQQADPTQAVKQAAEQALQYAKEQGWEHRALKAAFESKLSGARCYSVSEGVYHVLYENGYYIFTVIEDQSVEVAIAGVSDKLPVYATVEKAKEAIEADANAAPAGFLTRGKATEDDRGHAYYERTTDALKCETVSAASPIMRNSTVRGTNDNTTLDVKIAGLNYRFVSAESAIDVYQLGYAADQLEAAFYGYMFQNTDFHTLVFPQGDYPTKRAFWCYANDRSYYGLDATIVTDDSFLKDSFLDAVWYIRGKVDWSAETVYANVYDVEASGINLRCDATVGLPENLDPDHAFEGFGNNVFVRYAHRVSFKNSNIYAPQYWVKSLQVYGSASYVTFENVTAETFAGVEIRDLVNDGVGATHVTMRKCNITMSGFDEGLAIFAGNEEGLGKRDENGNVVEEYPILKDCLVSDLLVEDNTFNMKDTDSKFKKRIVAVTCGYQDSPVQDITIRNNTFNVCADYTFIQFGYAHDVVLSGNTVNVHARQEGKWSSLVERSSHTRTGPTERVLVSGNTFNLAEKATSGEAHTLTHVGESGVLGEGSLTFTGNTVSAQCEVTSQLLDNTCTYTNNVFNLNDVKSLYSDVRHVSGNTYNIAGNLKTLYEADGAKPTADIVISNERATIAHKPYKNNLMSFNNSPEYGGHSITFTNCNYNYLSYANPATDADGYDLDEPYRWSYIAGNPTREKTVVDSVTVAFYNCGVGKYADEFHRRISGGNPATEGAPSKSYDSEGNLKGTLVFEGAYDDSGEGDGSGSGGSGAGTGESGGSTSNAEATVQAAAESAVSYIAEQGYENMVLKDVLEQELPAARCFSVSQGVYHVLYDDGYYVLTLADDGSVSVHVAGDSEKLPVYDTLEAAKNAIAAHADTAPSAFLTRGLSSEDDRGNSYYVRTDEPLKYETVKATGPIMKNDGSRETRGTYDETTLDVKIADLNYRFTSAESALSIYQLGYAAGPKNAALYFCMFQNTDFHTFVLPGGDYPLDREVWTYADDRSYYGLGEPGKWSTLIAGDDFIDDSYIDSVIHVRGKITWGNPNVYDTVKNVEINGIGVRCTSELGYGAKVDQPYPGYRNNLLVRSAQNISYKNAVVESPQYWTYLADIHGTANYVTIDNVKSSTFAGVEIRDLDNQEPNVKHVKLTNCNITTTTFDEGLAIFAGVEEGLGYYDGQGVFHEYDILTDCLVEDVLVENNTFTMLAPDTYYKKRVVAVTCGYQDSPVRDVTIRNNKFDVVADGYFILFGYAEDCTVENNEVILRARDAQRDQASTGGNDTWRQLVTRSTHSRTGPTKNVTVSENSFTLDDEGNDHDLVSLITPEFTPEALTFEKNVVNFDGNVSGQFLCTRATVKDNTFNLKNVKSLYRHVGTASGNTYNISGRLGYLYEASGTKADADMLFRNEKVTAAEYGQKTLMSFNLNPSYSDHSMVFSGCSYDLQGDLDRYRRISVNPGNVTDSLNLTFAGCDITGFNTSPYNTLQNNEAERVKLTFTDQEIEDDPEQGSGGGEGSGSGGGSGEGEGSGTGGEGGSGEGSGGTGDDSSSGSGSETLPPVSYEVIDNANGAWDGDASGYLFSSNADFSKFVCVLVDGTILDSSCYDAVSGSTKVTLHADYLNTLAAGEHTATIRSTDGEATTTFTILASEESGSEGGSGSSSSAGGASGSESDSSSAGASVDSNSSNAASGTNSNADSAISTTGASSSPDSNEATGSSSSSSATALANSSGKAVPATGDPIPFGLIISLASAAVLVIAGSGIRLAIQPKTTSPVSGRGQARRSIERHR